MHIRNVSFHNDEKQKSNKQFPMHMLLAKHNKVKNFKAEVGILYSA